VALVSGRPQRSWWEAALGLAAAFFGTAPVALLASVGLARALPFAAQARFTLALTLFLPLWILGMCAGIVVRSAARAWIWCGVSTLGLSVVLRLLG
jgi:hypothetical protein